jgi:hypothetical protein
MVVSMSARRSFKRVLSAIKTMTLMYQKQRSCLPEEVDCDRQGGLQILLVIFTTI